MPGGSINVFDRELRYLFAEGQGLARVGLSTERLVGRKLSELFPPEAVDYVSQFYRRTFEGESLDFELEVGGQWFIINTAPLEGPHGRIDAIIATAQNITERKEAERERARLLDNEQRLRAEAEEANRLKDEFLATLSHELRTPLTAVLGWARLLGSGELDERSAARAVEVIERNAEAQKQLIDDILDVSRIITGKLALEFEPVEPAAVVAAAVEAVRPAAQAKRIALNVLAHEETGPVSGDAARLRQVVWNLLNNAVKFTPEGGRVEVRVGREGTSARVEVSDTGEGIRPEFLPYVFDRFRQADATTTRRRGGLGLGLAIVRHLVELHGGTVSAESEGVGRGTTFTVTLPLARESARAGRSGEGTRAAPERRRRERAGGPPSLGGLRVLVVEDERDTREFFASVLERGGAEVLTAENADEALRLIEGEHPDVLVSDIGMPGEDGYALIRKVRQCGDGSRNIPAIALTAYARESDKEKAIGAGFQAHLTKPVEPDELRQVVAGVARGTEGAGTG